MRTLKSLREELTKVMNGDEDAAEDLGLESKSVDSCNIANVSLRELKAEHNRFSLMVPAAKFLGMGILEKTAQSCLNYIAVLAQGFHNTKLPPVVVSPDETAEIADALIDELEQGILKVPKAVQRSDETDDDDHGASANNEQEQRSLCEQEIPQNPVMEQGRGSPFEPQYTSTPATVSEPTSYSGTPTMDEDGRRKRKTPGRKLKRRIGSNSPVAETPQNPDNEARPSASSHIVISDEEDDQTSNMEKQTSLLVAETPQPVHMEAGPSSRSHTAPPDEEDGQTSRAQTSLVVTETPQPVHMEAGPSSRSHTAPPDEEDGQTSRVQTSLVVTETPQPTDQEAGPSLQSATAAPDGDGCGKKGGDGTKPKKRVHYTKRKCPLCKSLVCNLRRHILDIHVKKNERIPDVRLEAIVQMAIHGNKTKGGKVVIENKEGEAKIYRQHKEICPLCDVVTIYLTTHLQRTHGLDKKSEQYKTALFNARRYRGRTAELTWDQEQIARQKAKERMKKTSTTRSASKKRKAESELEVEEEVVLIQKKKKKTGLQLLAEEADLRSTTSDESYFDESVREVPGSPLTGGKSIMSAALVVRKAKETPVSEHEDQEEEEEAGHKGETSGEEEEEAVGQEGDTSGDEEEEAVGQEGDTSGDEEAEKSDDGTSSDERAGKEEDVTSSEEEDSDYDDDDDDEELEDDEDENSFRTLQEYYRQGKGNSVKDTLLIMFCDYLQNIIGGCKSEKMAILHAQNVRRVLTCLDPKSQDTSVESLVENGGVELWKKWAKPNLEAKKMRPGTVRSYLTSINKFLNFIVDHTEHQVEGTPRIDASTMAKIEKIIPRIVAMGASVNKLYAHERWEQVLEDQVNAINPEDTNNMIDTEEAQRAISYLQKSATVTPNEKQFLAIRNFLMARIQLENGQRPGPIEEARVRDFQRMRKEGNKYIMHVPRHKTSRLGPAPLTMSENLKSNLDMYLHHVRPFFAAKNEEAIFVKKNGIGITPGRGGQSVTSWWRKATGKHFTSTGLRKMAASTLHHTDPAQKRSVHRLMCHTSKTAESYYMIQNLSEVAAHGHEVLAKNLKLKETVKTQGKFSPFKSPKVENSGNKSNALVDEFLLDEEQQREQEHLSPSKRLSEDQEDDIELLFSDIINTNAPLSLRQTKNIMSESINLANHINDLNMVKKVYYRVKYLQRREAPNIVASFKQDDATSRTASWAAASGGSRSSRMSWAKDDEQTIASAFSAFDKCPGKGMIQSVFNSTPEMQEIRQRNLFKRCYEKVKTIFKQKRNTDSI